MEKIRFSAVSAWILHRKLMVCFFFFFSGSSLFLIAMFRNLTMTMNFS